MKFNRQRRAPLWLVEDLYLRPSWGARYYLSRPRRFDRRQFFFILMLAVGLFDAGLAAFLVIATFFPAARPPSSVASRNAATRTVIARAQPTDTPEVPTRQPTRTRRAATATATRRRATATRQAPPTATPTRTRRPTQPSPSAQPSPVIQPASLVNSNPARTVTFDLPATLGVAALAIRVPPEPIECTPASQMPGVLTSSVKLCPGETYRPVVLRGEGIGIFGDDRKSAVIRSEGRAFAITADGARLFINNVVIRASTDPGDANVLLCLYHDCRGRSGGILYGGGILVRASDTTVMDSIIAGGVAGVAAERVSGLRLINNDLDNSTGWGSYNFAVESSYFMGNSLNDNNRSCVTPDGGYLPTGCESAGWLCVACQHNIIAQNTCTNSGDCYYMNGEGNLGSHNNRFHQNLCRASPHNCFEATFSRGNEFVENVTEKDPVSGAQCNYPFWVGGSQVTFARNQWRCTISPEVAIRHATDSTNEQTSVINQ